MFSRREDLIRKTGEDGIGRFEYLEQLLKEFNETKSLEAKHQVLANFANFAYDPINYDFFRRLRIIDLFLEQLAETDLDIVHFSIAGLCNCCLDPKNYEYIIRRSGIRYILPLLKSNHEEILLNTLTTLMYLITPETEAQIVNQENLEVIRRLHTSENQRIKNLTSIFLSDYFKQPVVIVENV